MEVAAAFLVVDLDAAPLVEVAESTVAVLLVATPAVASTTASLMVWRSREPVDRPILVNESILVELVADLAARLAPAELPARLEAEVPVDADLPTIDDLQVEAVDCLLSLLPGGVLDEAEATRSLLSLVQTHDQAHDLAALAEELHQLALIGEEGQVAHVEGRRLAETILVLPGGESRVAVIVH